METKDFRKLSVAELKEKLAEQRKELFNLRFRHATKQLENTARIPQVKQDVARILTVIGEKERGA